MFKLLTVTIPTLAFTFALMGPLFSAEVLAQETPDPTYNECFKMAENAIKTEMVGLDVEAANLGARGLATPADLPASASDNVTLPNAQYNAQGAATLPGLQGKQDFEQALREQGVRIVLDPNDPTAAPKVELDNVRYGADGLAIAGDKANEAAEEVPAAEEVADGGESNAEDSEETPEENVEETGEISQADMFQLKRSMCRAKFGIVF